MKLKMKTAEAIALANAIPQLDGRETAVGKGDQVRVIVQPFIFGTDVRSKMAVNIRRLRPVVEDYTYTRDALIKEISGGASTLTSEENPAEFMKFQDEVKKLLDAIIELDLIQITLEDLKLDRNMISPTVLAMIDPIVIERSKSKRPAQDVGDT